MQVQEDPTPGSAGLPGRTPASVHCRVLTVTQHLFWYYAGARRSYLRLCRPTRRDSHPTTLQSINSYLASILVLCMCKKILPQALQAYQEGLPTHYTAEYQQLISHYSYIMQVQEDPTPGSAGLPGRTPTPLHCRVSTVTEPLFWHYAGARRSYLRLCKPTRKDSRFSTLQSINSYSASILILCRCKKILPQALLAYQEGLPPHYTAEYHNAKLLAAMSVYSMQASYKTTTCCAFRPMFFLDVLFWFG